MRRLVTGDRVRLTGAFLRNTGQLAGGEGSSRWTVTACGCGLCRDGRFVTVDQASHDDPSQPRHILAANLERVRVAPPGRAFVDETAHYRSEG